MSRRLSGPFLIASAVAACSFLLALASLGFAIANRGLPVGDFIEDPPQWFSSYNAVSAVVFAVPGWYLANQRPRLALGWLLLMAGLGHGLAGAGWGYVLASEIGGHDYPVPWVGLWLRQGAGLEVPALAGIYLLYPGGPRPRGLLGALTLVVFVACGLALISAVFSPIQDIAIAPDNPIGRLRNPFANSLFSFDGDGVLWFAPVLVITPLALLWRWWRAQGELRQVLRWVILGSIPSVVVAPLGFGDPLWDMVIAQVPTVPLLAATVAGSLRHRVHGIEIVVSRAFQYTILIGLVALSYGVAVAAGGLAAGRTTPEATFLAAIVVAFLLAPARAKVERLVNRLLFGQRDEPYAVLSGVAARLEATGSPDQLLADFTTQVAAALRVPFVSMEMKGSGVDMKVTYGEPSEGLSSFSLVQRSGDLGSLVVGHRAGEAGFSEAETQLLQDLARQASNVAANLILTEELLRSRERIVVAQEEERRRLRRDLHDGLGPALTGAAMMIDAARSLTSIDSQKADTQLMEARTQVGGAIEDLRRLVYALRPPALDELGLVGALREQTRESAINVCIESQEDHLDLPAAVEVAAFRIISEAVNNVVRHAKATTCNVAFRLSGDLEIEITDDGLSESDWIPGVGLISIKERVSELGGECEIGRMETGGGRVFARLPLGAQT